MNAGTVLNKPSEDYGASTNASVLARVTYDYQNKYLATVNFRADGSSKFGVNNRWGYFPSFSLGWRLTGEEFMKPLDWLSDLKLRVGWGQVGNDADGLWRTIYEQDEVLMQVGLILVMNVKRRISMIQYGQGLIKLLLKRVNCA